jgi:sulfatase modifying factor 1
LKTKLCHLFTILALIAGINQTVAQGTQFFRVSGPAATIITAFRSNGTLVWSNALAGTNYTVQTVSSLSGATNWLDYVQLPVTNRANTNQLIDFHPPAGMTFIPAGIFTMGDTLDGEVNAAPANVTVSAFYMDVNLVNYSQWQSVYNWATNHGYGFVDVGAGKAPNHPVQSVDWYDCVKWCNARSQQAGLTPAYYTDAALTQVYTNGEVDIADSNVNWTANGYRLPTEAEWEKAARGGLSGQRFPWGDVISESLANYCSGFGGSPPSYDLGPPGFNAAFTNGAPPLTSPVGYFAANDYGLYDMSGNVDQWCWDWFGALYVTATDPHGWPSGTSRIIRGGDWEFGAANSRCAQRISYSPKTAYSLFGLRCVRGH